MLEDNEPFAQYHYLVTVYTGHRRGAATSSKVGWWVRLSRGRDSCPVECLAPGICIALCSIVSFCILEERISFSFKNYIVQCVCVCVLSVSVLHA